MGRVDGGSGARLWLLGTGGATKVCIVVHFLEERAARVAKPESEDGDTASPSTEAAARSLPGGNGPLGQHNPHHPAQHHLARPPRPAPSPEALAAAPPAVHSVVPRVPREPASSKYVPSPSSPPRPPPRTRSSSCRCRTCTAMQRCQRVWIRRGRYGLRCRS